MGRVFKIYTEPASPNEVALLKFMIISTRSFVGLDPWGLDPGAWKKPKLSKSEVNLKKVEKIHEKSKPVCEQSNR